MKLATITTAILASILLLKFTLWVSESIAKATLPRIEMAQLEVTQ